MAQLAWTFGDRLRKIRRVVGISQAELAETVQQGRKSLAAWEAGINEPRNPVAIAKRIELAYGIPAVWTLGLDAKTPGPSGPGVRGGLPGLDSNQQPFD